ncbi:MAG: fasciclin domain-containing protein [Chitinophagaceae bacterium]
MQKKLFPFLCAIVLAGTFMSCGDSSTKTETTINSDSAKMAEDNMKMDDTKMKEEGVMVGGAMMVASKDIVDNAAGSSDHTTLVAAVKAAGLVETLKGAGPFTVFAPTNDAFNKLPAGTVDNLLKPEMKKDLTGVLTYHVVSGAMKAADLKDGQVLKTVQGGDLKVSVKDGKVMINGATVTIADVVSSNGVTHVVDAVLLPKK